MVSETDYPLDVIDKVEPPDLIEEWCDGTSRLEKSWRLKDSHRSQVVHDGDLPSVDKFDDGVNVEIKLRRFIILGEHGVPENPQRAQRSVGEDDVAT